MQKASQVTRIVNNSWSFSSRRFFSTDKKDTKKMVVPVYINNVKPDSSILEACQSAGMIMKPNVCFKSASSSNCRICQIKVQDD